MCVNPTERLQSSLYGGPGEPSGGGQVPARERGQSEPTHRGEILQRDHSDERGRSLMFDLPSSRMGSPPWQWHCSRAMKTWWHCSSTMAPRERSACRRCTLLPATMTLGLPLCCSRTTPTQTSSARLVACSPDATPFHSACHSLFLPQTGSRL